jgi:hypothetical protein
MNGVAPATCCVRTHAVLLKATNALLISAVGLALDVVMSKIELLIPSA